MDFRYPAFTPTTKPKKTVAKNATGTRIKVSHGCARSSSVSAIVNANKTGSAKATIQKGLFRLGIQSIDAIESPRTQRGTIQNLKP